MTPPESGVTAAEASAPPGADVDATVPPVDDATWAAMKDKPVVLERGNDDAPVQGKLLAHEGTHAVVSTDDGAVVSVRKQDVTALKSPDTKPVTPPPPPAEKPIDKPKDDWKWHKLGLFTFHGVAYSRWRTPNYRSGAATYNLDAGVGFNFGPRFGVYALAGGAVGARLREKTVRGNYGHFALSFLVRRKYVAFIPGIGLALSGRRGPGDVMIRETGVAIPIKLMGLIPVKAGRADELQITVGLAYDLAIMANTRPLNSIGLQVGVARF